MLHISLLLPLEENVSIMYSTLRGQKTCQLCFKYIQLTGELNIEFSRMHYLQKNP